MWFDAWGISWGDSWSTSWGHDANGTPIEVWDWKLEPAGHWKHLFRPAMDANPPVSAVEGSGSLSVVRPEVVVIRVNADPVVIPATGVAYVSTVVVTTGTTVSVSSVYGTGKVGKVRVKGSANLYLKGVHGVGFVYATPSAGCGVYCKPVSGWGFTTQIRPKTIQNLPEAVLLALL